MRLHRLYLEEFKNLRKFTMDFDQESPFTIVVGRNGAGKSNVLEALVLIFRHLDLRAARPFPYVIEYECRGMIVSVDATADTIVYHAAAKDAEPVVLTKPAFEETDEQGRRRYLPAHVFGYYSGPSNRLEQHFDAHHTRFYKDLLRGKANAHLRPLFYARNIHSQFVLLAFFSGLGDDQREFLRKYLGIHELESVLFVLNEPAWGKAKKNRAFRWFWRAGGTVREFLDLAYRVALAPVLLPKVRIPLGLARSEHLDHVYLYLPSKACLQELAAPYAEKGGQEAFFAALESTYISDLIREIRVTVRVGSRADALSFRELSEGEQQLLMVLGLLKFTLKEEALFLLDEPDTHLNPAWSLQYLDLLGEVVGKSERSHFVITTHDPLVLAGRLRQEVRVMRRDASGSTDVVVPADDPRGMGVAALLTSDVYGLRSQLDMFTLNKIVRKNELAQKDVLTEANISELADINAYLDGLDLATSARDPGVTAWGKLYAMLQREAGVEGTSLTPEQSARIAARLDAIRADIAEEIRS